jgi:hypothetical protein
MGCQVEVLLGCGRVSANPGGFDRSMQHHLVNDLSKDGVYDPRETVETFFHAENGYLEPMEVRTVVA